MPLHLVTKDPLRLAPYYKLLSIGRSSLGGLDRRSMVRCCMNMRTAGASIEEKQLPEQFVFSGTAKTTTFVCGRVRFHYGGKTHVNLI